MTPSVAKAPSEPGLLARWMLREFEERDGYLPQHLVVRHVREANPSLVYRNKSGGWGLDPAILTAFRKLTDTSVVWSRSELRWRRRRERDKPNTRMVR